MKKVLVLGPAYPYRGGLAAYNERLTKEFQNEGWTAEVVTFTLQYPDFLFPGETQFSSESAPEGLKITRMVNSVNPFNWLKVGRMIRKNGCDLVLTRFWLPFMAPCLGTICRMARKNGKTKVVSLLDNVVPHEHRIGDKAFARYFIKSVDSFVAMSQSVLDDLRLFDKKKPAALCPHPLFDNFGEKVSRDEALRFLNMEPECRYMLFFGIIRDYKGLDLLLEAFADERFKSKNVKLIVAGEFYNGGEQYHELERKLGLEGRIIWHTEFVPDSQVKYFFNAADIVVQPYKSATQSGVTQIAYHFERPMLVTDVGGLKEMVPDGKVGYVTDCDSGKIADALVDFFDSQRMNEFETNVAEEKKKYSWSRMVETITKMMQ